MDFAPDGAAERDGPDARVLRDFVLLLFLARLAVDLRAVTMAVSSVQGC